MAGSWNDQAAPEDTVFVGEVGLAGEVRSVAQLEPRLRDARKMGFCRAVAPPIESGKLNKHDMEILSVKNVSQLLKEHLGFR
jgi:DNA repair protein RadA/Sms